MVRTYGKIRYGEREAAGRPAFGVQAQPHVMMKLKRTFPRARQHPTAGYLILAATQEVARDLEWFCDRYPLTVDDAGTLEALTSLADAHRRAEESRTRILDGAVPDYGDREPALTPREYQKVVPALLKASGYLLVADEVGLGKTMSSSLILTDASALPALVVAPKHLVGQWQDELNLYYPWLKTHIIRKGIPYDVHMFRGRDVGQPDVLITTYHKLYGWADHLAGKIRTVIFDEGHELRTGVGTDKYVGASLIAQDATYRVIATATPVYNYADEIHNVVSILAPDALGTSDEFTREWGGKKIPNPRALGAYLRDQGIMIRRTRKEVKQELPPVSSVVQPVETDHNRLDRLIQEGIEALAAKVLADATDPEERFTAAGQLDMRLRRATGLAKAPYVAQFVRLLLEQESKVLLVGHHHDVYEIWRHHLEPFKPVSFTGKESDHQKRESVRRFVSGDSRVMLMAVRSGAGLNGLQEVCSTVVFGELDWSPAQHHQVIGRLARDGQTLPVAAFYMLSDSGADPPMADLLDIKRRIAEPISDPDAELVQPAPAVAMDRVKALASSLLRQRGIDPNRPQPVPPVPAVGTAPAVVNMNDFRVRLKETHHDQ